MDSGVVQSLAATAVAFLVTGILFSILYGKRHRERLVELGRRHGMALIHGDASKAAVATARRFARREQNARIRDVLVGEDEEGLYHFARRSIAGHSHHVLFAINASECQVQAFHVSPLPAIQSKPRRWYQFGTNIDRNSDWQLELQWSSPRSYWLGKQTLGMAVQTLNILARASDEKGAVPMGVEIHSRYVAIHSDQPLKGKELHRFVEDSLRLRRHILHLVRRTDRKSGEVEAPAKAVRQTERVTVLSTFR